MFVRPGNGFPVILRMESKVFLPMTTGCPVVSALKRLRSSGRRHGMPLSRPITPLRAIAAMMEIRGRVTARNGCIVERPALRPRREAKYGGNSRGLRWKLPDGAAILMNLRHYNGNESRARFHPALLSEVLPQAAAVRIRRSGSAIDSRLRERRGIRGSARGPEPEGGWPGGAGGAREPPADGAGDRARACRAPVPGARGRRTGGRLPATARRFQVDDQRAVAVAAR